MASAAVASHTRSSSMATLLATPAVLLPSSASDERTRYALRFVSSSQPQSTKNTTINTAGTNPISRYETISLRRTRQSRRRRATWASLYKMTPAPVASASPPMLLRTWRTPEVATPAAARPTTMSLTPAPMATRYAAILVRKSARIAPNLVGGCPGGDWTDADGRAIGGVTDDSSVLRFMSPATNVLTQD